MNLAARVPERNLHLSPRKSDDLILDKLAQYQFLTVEQMSAILPREITATRQRMLQLYRAGILNRGREHDTAPYVYFLAEKGAKEAARLGYLPEPRFISSKSRLIIRHDLEITQFHLAVEKTGELSSWEQWRGDLKYEVSGESLIPDARFTLGDRIFFLEIVKSYESEYENGESNIVRKAGLYMDLKPDNFRVLWVLPTKARVLGLLSKLEDKYPYRRFYLTDEDSYKTNFTGKIWWTPKDFRDQTYSIIA